MTTRDETAEDFYIEQHATIQAAIDKLQAVLDNMISPYDPAQSRPINWQDVATNAHVAAAANVLLESIGQ